MQKKRSFFQCELARYFYVIGNHTAISIDAMTESSYDEDMKQVQEAGMNAHLAKSVASEVLYEIKNK